MKDLHGIVKDHIAITHQKLHEELLAIYDNDKPDTASIDKTIALTLHLQKLIIRLGATLPKDGTPK